VAANRSLSLYEAASQLPATADINGPTRKRLAEFVAFIAHLQGQIAVLQMAEIVPYVIQASGYDTHLRALPPQESRDRMDNVEELAQALTEYGQQAVAADTTPTLGGFLDQAALVSDIDSLDDGQGVLPLMTLHLAKGLEFPVAYMVGMEEGLLPHRSSMDQPDELEEERRLCYVGITRARHKLHMTYAFRRRVYGTEQYNIPSRFLKDIPKELVEWDSEAPRHESRMGQKSDDEFDQTGGGPLGGDFSQDTDDATWKIGMKVKHPQFGVGVIRRIEGRDDKTKLTIYFGPHIVKTLMVQYAQLTPTT
jgi:DNA helicase-2/ATP-dependent DNA helicase PcrA